MQTSEATKTCSICGGEFPIDQFKRRRLGSERREGRCKNCCNAWARQYRQRRRVAEFRRFPQHVNRASRTAHIEATLAGMFRRFGGWEGFVDAWAAEIAAEQKRRRPRKFLGDSFRAILRLMEAYNEERPAAEFAAMDYSRWSDEQLVNRAEELAAAMRPRSGAAAHVP